MVAITVTSVLIFLASTIGAVAGIGGGVIIKPVLDALQFYDLRMINFISTCAVFAMSVASIYKHIKGRTKFDKKQALFIATGAMLGGNVGEMLFEFLHHVTKIGSVLTAVQNFVLLLLLVFTIVYSNLLAKRMRFAVTNGLALFIIGVFLGVTGSFLGIGGGPINVVILIMCLSLTAKDVAVYSIMAIFFSQLSKLVSMAVTGEFYGMPFHLLIPVIPLAVLGGIIGTWMNKRYSERIIQHFFTSVTAVIICLNVVNIMLSLRK